MAKRAAPLRIGLIGAGAIGAWHARIVAESADATLAAIADIDGARADALAGRFGGRSYGDADAMLATESLDGVIIASPESFHEPHALAAARHRVAMLVEKPVAPDVAAIERVRLAAAAADVPVMAGHVERFEIGSAQLRRAVAQGLCGRVTAIAARRQFVGLDAPRFKGLSSTLRVLGVHDFDLVSWVHPSPVASVYAAAGRGEIFDVCGLDDHVVTTLAFADGAVALVESAWTLPASYGGFKHPADWSPAGNNRLDVFGSRGMVSNDMSLRNQQLIAFDEAEGFRAGGLKHQSILHGRVVGALVEEVAAFLRLIETGGAPLVGLEDAARAVRITHMAEMSLRLGRPVGASEA